MKMMMMGSTREYNTFGAEPFSLWKTLSPLTASPSKRGERF
jgi:hypothetical protein